MLDTFKQFLVEQHQQTLIQVKSEEPVTFPMRFACPLGYKAARLLAVFDEYIKLLILAYQYGVIQRLLFYSKSQRAWRWMVTLFNRLTRCWRSFALTREDVMQNTLIAQQAAEWFHSCIPESKNLSITKPNDP